MQRIHICHVIDASTFNPLLYNSVKHSDQSAFKYTVIGLGPAGQLQEQMHSLGVHSFSLNYTTHWQSLSVIWKLYRYFRKEKIDIVQTHLFSASLLGLFAARLARVPLTVFTGHHSHEVPLYKRRLLTFIDGVCGRWLAKKTIAPSNVMKNIFIKEQKIPPHKIEVIAHGFDLENWRLAATEKDVKKELGLKDKIVFGAVGRMFWVKDFETLLYSFAQIARQRSDVVLLMVGDGNDRNKLKELTHTLGISHQVIFTGKRMDIAAVINSFDVFVHTALAESFGMVFIEAFALGKPVVSTPVGVAPDIIENGKNGYLVNPKNISGLADALIAVLDKKEQWPMIARENMNIANRFAVQQTQALCDNFYLTMLKKKL